MSQYIATDLVTYWIKHAYLGANQRADALLSPYGLGRTQWHILQYLSQHELMGQRELQKTLRVESPTLAAIVGSMAEKGWIEQLPSSTDKRKKDVRLTPEGKRLHQTVTDPVLAVEKAATQGLSREEIQQATKLLARLTRNLENKYTK